MLPHFHHAVAFDRMADGKVALQAFDDDGKNAESAWKRVPGGEAHRITYVCSMHVDCGVKVRLNVKSLGGSLERIVGVEHSSEMNEFDRSNAALTKSQKKAFIDAKRYGGTASDIMKHEQGDVLNTPGGKRKADDVGVEGVYLHDLA